VFEEDLDLTKSMLEKLKETLFESKPQKEIQVARKTLVAKAKAYYSNEALNPRPKRGRPPKQVQKPDIEIQISRDIYTMVPPELRTFLFAPEIHGGGALSFSAKFETEETLTSRRLGQTDQEDVSTNITETLASLKKLSDKWIENKDDNNKSLEETPSLISEEKSPQKKQAKRPMRRVMPRKSNSTETIKKIPKKRIMPTNKK